MAGKARKSRVPRSRAARPDPLKDLVETIIGGSPTILELDDPTDAEMWGSDLLGLVMSSGADSEAVVRLCDELVRSLSRRRTPDALAFLRSLSSVAPPPSCHRALLAASTLAEAGVPDQPWGAVIGKESFSGAWLVTHPYRDQDALVAAFRHEGWPVDGLSVLIDHNLGGILKSAFPIEDPGGVADGWRAQPDMTVEPIAAAEIRGRIERALAMTDMTLDPPVADEFFATHALLEARMRALPKGWEEEPRPEFGRAERDTLVDDFLGSPWSAGVPNAEQAGLFVDYASDYGAGDPLRWNPVAVELFLCDWYPRKVLRAEDVAPTIPSALRAWIRYTGERVGFPSHLVAETLEAVDRFEPELLDATQDRTHFGPAKAIMLAMMDEGVDPTDPRAVQSWMESFNARTTA
ncbi:MAG: hypothetical protein M3Q23_04280 [Actinomycetota bacterium]|nr:hypothetical protein [Actinomycetota bacterium]